VAAPASSSSFDFASAGASRRRRRKKGGGGWWAGVAVLASVLLLAVGVAAVFRNSIWSALNSVKPITGNNEDDLAAQDEPRIPTRPGGRNGPKTRPGSRTRPSDPVVKGSDPDENPKTKPLSTPSGAFPRRALIISVHNYLYANPITDGPTGSVNVERLVSSLNRGLRIPLNQITRLSDAAKKQPRPPMKPVIEKTLESFLATSRAQDRIMVVFIGHTAEIDGEGYLAPMEGELDNARTLIPLKSVLDLMKKCKARQKILVLDGNRFNPAQGLERPASGPMSPRFEAALKSPPSGVQVWSACSSGQQSIEQEGIPLGLFLDGLRLALTPERGQKGALEGRIPQPNDLIPLAPLNNHVNKNLASELNLKDYKQVAFLAGNAPTSGADHDRSEKAAAAPELAKPVTGDVALIRKVFEEVSVPPVKGGNDASSNLSFSVLPPFSAQAMKKYDGQAAADSPVRKAVHNARVILFAINTAPVPTELQREVGEVRTKLKVDLSIMKESYVKPGAGQAETRFKEGVFNDGKEMSRIFFLLEDTLDEMKKAEADKDKEPLRWQANYDFVRSRLEAQMAYLNEYTSALGSMRKEYPAGERWKLASTTTMQGDPTGKRLARNSRSRLEKLAKKHADTPWEVLAKREKLTALGLQWQSY
jgi:hypothetical protein